MHTFWQRATISSLFNLPRGFSFFSPSFVAAAAELLLVLLLLLFFDVDDSFALDVWLTSPLSLNVGIGCGSFSAAAGVREEVHCHRRRLQVRARPWHLWVSAFAQDPARDWEGE